MEEYARVLLFHFAVDLIVVLEGRGDSGGDVVDDYLDHLNHFLEASCRYVDRAEGFFTLGLDFRRKLKAVGVTAISGTWWLLVNRTSAPNILAPR